MTHTYNQAVSEPEVSLESISEKVDLIGMTLAQTRSEAIAGRQDSGIEEEWLEDEEYYEGIDDANRQELKAWRGKPLGQLVPLEDDKDDRGSTIFLNITRPYVDATAARMGDMLLPTDDRGWAIKPTPVADLMDIADYKFSPEIRDAIKAESANGEEYMEKARQLQGEAEEEMQVAKDSAKKAENQIWDWHVESQYHAHNRRLIEDAAKVGTGILKGPIPAKSTKLVFKDGKLEPVSKTIPVSRRVYYRNFFPDPACGEDIHNGNYTWERDDITRKGLMKLDGAPGYISEQIKRCIQEGPQDATKEFREDMDNPGLKASSDARKYMFEIWYYHGTILRKDLECMDMACGKLEEGEESDYGEDEYMFVQVTMVNNRVIKATLSHLQTGEFPYDVMIWQRRIGMPWGIGIARQIRPAQKIVVGAMRHMMDNAGIAGGPMLFVDDNLIEAAGGPNEVLPWKIWVGGEKWDPEKYKLEDALAFITAPMLQPELQAIIDLGITMAEHTTGLPLIMQGQTSQRTPSTLGGMQMQNNNASTVLRRVARLYDDLITEPHIRRYYNYILQYGEDDSMKGEFTIDALGSSALIERDMQEQGMMQIGQFVTNPVFGKDPKKWLDEMLKGMKIDPERLNYEDDDWKQIVEQMQQPQTSDPRLEVAQINAQSKLDLQQNEQDFEQAMTDIEQELNVYQGEMKEEGTNVREFEKLKVDLQKLMMTLKTQIALNGTNAATPVVEPAGRAGPGRAFQE